jgi:predicted PurR-regulated permease PerM
VDEGGGGPPIAGIGGNEIQEEKELSAQLKRFIQPFLTKLTQTTGIPLDDQTLNQALSLASGYVAKSAITVVQSVIKILVGLVIMVIALYYFLADGPGMIRALMRLSPLDNRYEQELLERFAQVSRAVVVATLLSAVVQGALAGIGYYFALPPEAPIFLLTALTMVTAMIPFFGAAAVWVLVCGWVYLHGELSTTIILAAYCTVIVSGIDNIIKPLVLHGQSNLHPLLALLSILGGVTVLGPVGILVGPMLVSFLQALLNMLRKELELFGQADKGTSPQLAVSGAGSGSRAADSFDESAPAANSGVPPGGNSLKATTGSRLSRFRRKKGKR